jgi:phospholipid N-methyltransferase
MSPEGPQASGNGHEPGTPRTGSQILKFGRTFLGAPSMLGSVIPSSRFLVRKALDQVDWSRARLVVEYGPGMGTFTGEILKRLGPDGRLLAFETHPDFVRHLEEAIRDPRLEVVHGSAEEVETAVADRGWGPADYVVSGIPFSLMPGGVRDSILRGTRAVLAPGGAFLVYQFSPSIGPHLKDVFGEVEWGFEPRNFLPAMVFRCMP